MDTCRNLSQEKVPKAPLGRPKKIKSVKEMQESIDRYFTEAQTAVRGRDGSVTYVPGPYTVTGLALALGLSGRMSLLRYEGRPEYQDTVRRAKARVEEYAESHLYTHGCSTGAKFALENNFDGWRMTGRTGSGGPAINGVEEAMKFLLGLAGLLEAVQKNSSPETNAARTLR